MRILRVISSTNPVIGGPIEGIRQITPVLSAMGHATDVVTLDAPCSPWLADAPFTTHAIGPVCGGYCYSPKLVPWLRSNAAMYDFVVVHGLWQYTSYGAWRAMSALKRPYFVYPHGMLDPYFKRAHPFKHLKKCLYWPWAEYRVLRDAAAVCFTCEEERILARQSFGIYRCREAVVSYGTSAPAGAPDALREAFYKTQPSLRGKRFLLFLSRIHPKKGCDLLIEAFARLSAAQPDLTLVMAGPDEVGYQASLMRQATERGVADRIVWPGMLRGDVKWGAFQSAEAFALISHQENFGIAVAEALACGLPVLISNKVNIWREIRQSGAGLVNDDTADGAFQLLSSWASLSTQARKEMGVAARDVFNARFEIRRSAQSLLELAGHVVGTPMAV